MPRLALKLNDYGLQAWLSKSMTTGTLLSYSMATAFLSGSFGQTSITSTIENRWPAATEIWELIEKEIEAKALEALWTQRSDEQSPTA